MILMSMDTHLDGTMSVTRYSTEEVVGRNAYSLSFSMLDELMRTLVSNPEMSRKMVDAERIDTKLEALAHIEVLVEDNNGDAMLEVDFKGGSELPSGWDEASLMRHVAYKLNEAGAQMLATTQTA